MDALSTVDGPLLEPAQTHLVPDVLRMNEPFHEGAQDLMEATFRAT